LLIDRSIVKELISQYTLFLAEWLGQNFLMDCLFSIVDLLFCDVVEKPDLVIFTSNCYFFVVFREIDTQNGVVTNVKYLIKLESVIFLIKLEKYKLEIVRPSDKLLSF